MKITYCLAVLSVLLMIQSYGDSLLDSIHKLPKKEKVCSNLYPFQDGYVDLDKLEFIETDSDPIEDFKSCELFSSVFKYTNPYDTEDSIKLDDFIYELDNREYELTITNTSTNKNLTIKLPVPNPLPKVYDLNSQLTHDGKNIIVIGEDYYGTQYFIWKYNEKGELIQNTHLPHAFVRIEDNVHHHETYMYFDSETYNEIVFSSTGMIEGRDSIYIIQKADLTKTGYPFRPVSYILDERNERIQAFITYKNSSYHIEENGKDDVLFNFDKNDDLGANEALICDSLLVLTGYHPNMTGSNLSCISRKTGKLKWKADVLRMNVGHSKYSNDVILTSYDDFIIMEGIESYGEYLQIFDLKTGKRLAAFGDVH